MAQPLDVIKTRLQRRDFQVCFTTGFTRFSASHVFDLPLSCGYSQRRQCPPFWLYYWYASLYWPLK